MPAIKRRYIRITILILATIAVTSIAIGVWIAHAVRQQRLDRALIAAIRSRSTAAVISLLDQGADPNTTDRPYAPVTLKSWLYEYRSKLYGKPAYSVDGIYQPALLLAYGVLYYKYPGDDENVWAFNAKGSSYEINDNFPKKVIEIMLGHGARLDTITGDKLLICACLSNDLEVVRELLARRVSSNTVVNGDLRPLWCTSDYDCVRLLLENDADPNARGPHGETRIMYAENKQLYPLLIEHGADPNLQDGDGRTALMALCIRRYVSEEMILYATRFLLERGAKASLKDKGGFTALDYAKGASGSNWRLIHASKPVMAQCVRLLEDAMKRERNNSPTDPK